MDAQAYNEYLQLIEEGRNHEAKTPLNVFLASISEEDDVEAWVKSFLESRHLDAPTLRNVYIRHEIYERLVFPVLNQGYKRKDAWSVLWLARTLGNLVKNPSLHAQIENKGGHALLTEAYALEPSEEIKQTLLDVLIDGFRYAEHEFPAGILVGNTGANVAECDKILQDVEIAKGLDTGEYAIFLPDFENKVRFYQARLRRAETI